jgi:hypothetical protein
MTGVVVSSSLIVLPGDVGYNTDSPIVGYRNIVTTSNITATTEATGHPASYLANPATHLYWASGAGSPSSDEYLTVTTGTPDDVDYLAVAAHNFGTAQATLTVEAVAAEPGSPADWIEIVGPMIPADDGPILFRWTPTSYYGVRLKISASGVNTVTPQCAVLYVGSLLMLQRRIYVGHSPINYHRRSSIANHRSVNGAFLGRIVLSERNLTTVTMTHLTPDWFRASLWPFIQSAVETPFFFAWRPGTYPLEVGYAWLTDDPAPNNAMSNGMMSISLNVEGVI